jgi:cytosine/adenosine deaminase-related metal-dependent hydrolase
VSAATILTGGTVLTSFERPQVLTDAAVAWDGERISDVGPAASIAARHPEADRLDARGGLVVPGLVNLHHHVLAALARGLDPGYRTRSFGDLLDGLWWRLDRVVTPDAVRAAARLTAAECARWGTTTVFLHHSSPSCLRHSLDLLAAACDEVGLTAVVCYGVSDRNGHHEALAGIDENAVFVAAHRDHPRVRGMFGLHASFTVADATLAAIADRRGDGVGCHLHLAEDLLDVQASKLAYGAGPLQRLERFGLLDERALLVHGLHLSRQEHETVALYGATLVHCPESNALHGVGRFELDRVARRGCRVGVGTCGASPSVLHQLRFSALGQRAARRDPSSEVDLLALLAASAAVAGEVFDDPTMGRIEAGAPADLAVLDLPLSTPTTPETVEACLLESASAPVRHTVARGRAVVRDFEPTTVDLQAASREAAGLVPALWARFAALDPSRAV